MVDRNLNLVLAPQFVVNIVHEMGGEGGLTIVAGIASSGSGGGGSMTDTAIKAAYERNANTNEFSDAEQTKLAGLTAGAQVLNDLTDVNLTSLAEADIIGYDAGSSKFVNYALTTAKIANIDENALADGALLVYDGPSSKYVATAVLDNPNTSILGGTF